MAKTRKNNRQLKSMEEFKCKSSALKLVYAVLIVILISLLFFSRGTTSQEVVKAETTCIDLTNQFDTNQQKDTENTSIPEASDIVETENQFEAEESSQTTESIETIQNVKIADYIKESASEEIPLEELIIYEDFIVPITEYEIQLMVRAVQHEVGKGDWFFPDADFDYVQQCMARVIVNKVGTTGCGDTIYSTLILSGHFMKKEALFQTEIKDGQEVERFDPYNETTRRNVLTVLRGEDSISHTITVEMSFPTRLTFDECIEKMERDVGPVIPYFWAVTKEPRLWIVAERDEERNAAEANKKIEQAENAQPE